MAGGAFQLFRLVQDGKQCFRFHNITPLNGPPAAVPPKDRSIIPQFWSRDKKGTAAGRAFSGAKRPPRNICAHRPVDLRAGAAAACPLPVRCAVAAHPTKTKHQLWGNDELDARQLLDKNKNRRGRYKVRGDLVQLSNPNPNQKPLFQRLL